ncbi:MAG: outer membrane lipoprotein carrier protein LolA [Deltaproteobacteria bacterium]|nr:outer membrane lipoprotein carrier protein LolA [Deltaproteobacteria bacterium]
MILSISAETTAGEDDRLSVVLEGILKRYGEFKGMSVSYKREIITKSMAMLGDEAASDTATGTIIFTPPHCLAIQQETPGRETVTTDGEILWYYIETTKTVYEYPAESLGREIRLLSDIFSGLSNVCDSFDIELEENEEYSLKLVPNPLWDDMDHIVLLVERGTYNIRVVEIYDLLGGITRFRLERPSTRNDLKKDDFIFKAPSGVETVKE